jgi:hypothetical protein
MRAGPRYSYTIHAISGKSVVSIIDLYSDEKPSMTVTNGAEIVLRAIAAGEKRSFSYAIYRDGSGHWDRVLLGESGAFIGFAPILAGYNEISNEREALELLAVQWAEDQVRH